LASTGKENPAGLIERVTFHNENSGFCVLRVKARGQRDLITVVGHAAAIGAGEFVHASGRSVPSGFLPDGATYYEGASTSDSPSA
jgi:hypothetical protein